MVKLRDLVIILVLIAVLAVAGFVFYNAGYLTGSKTNTTSPTPSVEPVAQVLDKETEVVSQDGKQTLTMKETTKDGLTSYAFFLSNDKEKQKQVLYSTDFLNGVSYELPFNSFSPEGKFLFIKSKDGEGDRYLVFSTKISPEKLQDPVEVGSVFSAKYSDVVITDVTGWGGLGLLVINADSHDGKTGPSFWYEAATGRFIRLSTRFN